MKRTTNRNLTPAGENERTGRVGNFAKAARLESGAFAGRRYNDSDVYKAVEAASYVLAAAPP